MNWPDVMRWRRDERARLIAARMAVPADQRTAHTKKITDALEGSIAPASGRIIAAYWPFRGEPDLRPWLEDMRRLGHRTALPVVVAKNAPLVFRLWRDGEPLERGIWDIPVPASGEPVTPDIVIAPLVGFDRQAYRLGYGGGYFDRTLAKLPQAVAIGVGYAFAALPTIHPQPFDIPMDRIVTDAGIAVRPAPSL